MRQAAVNFNRYIPWRKIKAWSCLGCGSCCTHFRIILRPYEYALLTAVYGQETIQIDSTGNPCLRKVGGRCIFQDSYGWCILQPLGMKPLACKIWPFVVCSEAKSRYNPDEALFTYKGRDYYIYVDRSHPCQGFNVGTLEKLYSTITEIIELQLKPSRQQLYSTYTLNPEYITVTRMFSTSNFLGNLENRPNNPPTLSIHAINTQDLRRTLSNAGKMLEFDGLNVSLTGIPELSKRKLKSVNI